MDEVELKARTKKLGLRVIRMVEALPPMKAAAVITNQILRSSTSVGANYRAACRSKSKPDFALKIAIALEEADETLYWLELIVEAELLSASLLDDLMKETNEIISILVASLKTARNTVAKGAYELKPQSKI